MKENIDSVLSLLISIQLYNDQTRNRDPGHRETAVWAGEGILKFKMMEIKVMFLLRDVQQGKMYGVILLNFPWEINVWKPLCKATDAVKKTSQSHIQPFQLWTMCVSQKPC